MGTWNENGWRGENRGGGKRCGGGPIRPVRGQGHGWGEKPDYHTAALCKQVGRMVGMTLSGECADEVLQGLVVEEVLPAPGAGRLLVRVMLRVVEGGPGVVEVLQKLEGVMGLLRHRVGEGIVRKRTPELVFEIIPYRNGGGPPAEKQSSQDPTRNNGDPGEWEEAVEDE
jgi:hypothetical protein